MEPITFEMHRRLSDYRQAYRAMQPRAQYYAAAGVLCVAIFILMVWNPRDEALWGFLTATATFLALHFGNYGYCIQVTLPQRAFKAHATNEPISYTFTEDGIAMSTAVGSSTTSWRAFTRYSETAETLVVVFPNTIFYVIPKRDVPPDRLSDLRALLERQVGH